jgi:hypothetical protein
VIGILAISAPLRRERALGFSRVVVFQNFRADRFGESRGHFRAADRRRRYDFCA